MAGVTAQTAISQLNTVVKAKPQLLTLNQVEIGQQVTLHSVASEVLGNSLHVRLHELGLRLGQTIHIVQRTAGGGRLLKVGDARYAVDRFTAAALSVLVDSKN